MAIKSVPPDLRGDARYHSQIAQGSAAMAEEVREAVDPIFAGAEKAYWGGNYVKAVVEVNAAVVCAQDAEEWQADAERHAKEAAKLRNQIHQDDWGLSGVPIRVF